MEEAINVITKKIIMKVIDFQSDNSKSFDSMVREICSVIREEAGRVEAN